jgi:hypothetical protein
MISDLNATLRTIAMYFLALAIPATIIAVHYYGFARYRDDVRPRGRVEMAEHP